MNGAAAGQMTDLKRGSPPLTTTKNRELLCYRTIIEYCEHVVSKNDRRDFIRHVNTRGHDRTDESSSACSEGQNIHDRAHEGVSLSLFDSGQV